MVPSIGGIALRRLGANPQEKDEYVLKTKDQLDLVIQLTAGQDSSHKTTIRQKNAQEGPRNLGAHLAPSRNNTDELAHLVAKGRTLSQNVAVSKLLCRKIMIACCYRTMIRLSMKYPLWCSTTFTSTENVIIDQAYLPGLLSHKAGFQ
jgi:hypothetical protein